MLNLFPCLQIPQPDYAVVSAPGHFAPIGGKRRGVHHPIIGSQPLQQLAGPNIPHTGAVGIS